MSWRDRHEERREAEREYEGDVYYEVWRRGGNPDRVDMDCVSECFDQDIEADQCAAHHMQRVRAAQYVPTQEEEDYGQAQEYYAMQDEKEFGSKP